MDPAEARIIVVAGEVRMQERSDIGAFLEALTRLAESTHPGASISDLSPVRRTFRSASYRARLVTRESTKDLIVKVALDKPRTFVEREIRVLRALEQAPSVPAPRLVFDGELDGRDGGLVLANEWVPGENPDVEMARGEWQSREAIEKRIRALVGALPFLYECRPPAFDLHTDRVQTPREAAKGFAAKLRQKLEPTSIVSRCSELLIATAPEPAGICLVHGDYRLGNAIFRGDDLAAILDWERGRMGDPRVDVGYLFASAERSLGSNALDSHRQRWVDELARDHESSWATAVTDVEWFAALGHCRLALVRQQVLHQMIAKAIRSNPETVIPRVRAHLTSASRESMRSRPSQSSTTARSSWDPEDHLHRAVQLLAQ